MALSDESSTFETTAITHSVGCVTGSVHGKAKTCSDGCVAGHRLRRARRLYVRFWCQHRNAGSRNLVVDLVVDRFGIPSQTSGSPSSVLTSPSPTVGTDSGPPAGEAADRAAVEAQWVRSWDVLLAIGTTPAGDREALAATVAVDPTKANIVGAGTALDNQGLQTYGTLGHRISWPQDINGKTTALIDDCQDRSGAGAYKTSTGDKITVGVPRDHYQGSLVKGDDGVWRVAEVYYLKDEPC